MAAALSYSLSLSLVSLTSFRRAEFWDGAGTANSVDLVNVLGRWQTCDEWRTRSEFVELENAREKTQEQSATRERYEMARRLDQVERIAMQQNVPRLPFTDAKLARACGMTVEDFEQRDVSPVAVDIVFDALVESKSSLLDAAACDSRRARFLTAEGGLDDGAFSVALYKARVL
eukprot:2928868-Prymnesium_polylepis.1